MEGYILMSFGAEGFGFTEEELQRIQRVRVAHGTIPEDIYRHRLAGSSLAEFNPANNTNGDGRLTIAGDNVLVARVGLFVDARAGCITAVGNHSDLTPLQVTLACWIEINPETCQLQPGMGSNESRNTGFITVLSRSKNGIPRLKIEVVGDDLRTVSDTFFDVLSGEHKPYKSFRV